MTALVKFDEARRALALATSIDEVKDIRDKAEALRAYVRQQGESLEMQNQCAEIKLRAERRAGEILREQERATRGPGKEKNITSHPATSNSVPTLAEIGINKTQSSRWQQVAELPEETFEQHIAEIKAKKKELTSASVQRLAKKKRNEKKRTVNTNMPAHRAASKLPQLYIGQAENMHFIESVSIDVIITSPPYNIGRQNMPMGGDGRTPRENGIGYDRHDDAMSEGKYQAWQLACLKEMFRVAKDGASLFYNHKVRNRDGRAIHPMEWIGHPENPWTLRQEIIWDRGSTHNHNPVLFWPHDERIYWLTKGKPTLEGKSIGKPTIWREHGPVADTWHPAPFTPALPRMCLDALGLKGAMVLDPFAGSCTTIKVATSEYGYDAIGVDISKEYLDKAREKNGWTNEHRA